MDEPREHDAQREKPDTKGHIVCGSIDKKCPEIGRSIESRSVTARGLGCGGNETYCSLGTGFSFGVKKMFWS